MVEDFWRSVTVSGQVYVTEAVALRHWGTVGEEQGRHWFGSGKWGGMVISQSGEKLVPADEARRVTRWIEVAFEHGAVRVGGWLPLAYRGGHRLPPEEELWPAPLIAAVLHRAAAPTPRLQHFTQRRVEQPIGEGGIVSGQLIGNTLCAPLASVLAFVEGSGGRLVWGGPVVSGCPATAPPCPW